MPENQNEPTKPKDAEGVESSGLLAALDALYEERGKIQHEATWGGSYETETRAAEDLRINANAIFGTTLELLKSRAANSQDQHP